jgi:DNA-binding transcriptional regulator YdaS (Cro superfamily)
MDVLSIVELHEKKMKLHISDKAIAEKLHLHPQRINQMWAQREVPEPRRVDLNDAIEEIAKERLDEAGMKI